METICPSRFAITVIITTSLIDRDAPLLSVNAYPGGSERLRRLSPRTRQQEHQIGRIKMTRVLAAALSLFITASAALISTVSGLEAKTLGIVALIDNHALNVA